ncbi:MAG: HupE/UreJ family protein [Pseudomonadales bacterium]
MRILAIALLLALTTDVFAHEVRPAFLKLVQTEPNRFTVTLKQPQIQGRYLGLRATTNCENSTTPIVSVNARALEEEWEILCEGEELRRIDIIGLDRTMIDTLVNIGYTSGDVINYLINPDAPYFNVVKQTPWLPMYLTMGVEHLLMGVDHLLFVIVLMFVVRGKLNLIKAVTSFTVAHSITLGLSAFNIVNVSQAPVEATIALSIVVLSLQAFNPGTGNPWAITFLFGLLHGLGFAGALSEIGLPENAAWWALLFFNMGIELGQLIIITLVLGLLYLRAQFRLTVPRWVQTAPLFFAGALASYWLILRTTQIIF